MDPRNPTSPGAAALSLEVPSSVQMIRPVDVFVGEVAASAGLDPDSAQDVEIAVHEAVINAIVHGNGRDPSRRVRLEIAVGPANLEVRVHDEGRGFDPSGVPDPLDPANLRRPCGRGILLMRRLVDEVRFGRAADGGTLVTLVKRRSRLARTTRQAQAAVSYQ